MKTDISSKKSNTKIIRLQQLPRNSNICLYGSGDYADRLLQLFSVLRPDIHIPFLVDSFMEGRKYGHEIIHIERLRTRRNDFDYIFVASSFIDEIISTLDQYDFKDIMIPDDDIFFVSVIGENCVNVPYHRFNIVLIEPTTACNMRCAFCDLSITSRPQQHIDFALFKKIIDQISDYKITTTVNLHGDGEPLLYPHIVPAIQYCKNKGLRVHLNTNSLLLTRDLMLQLINAGLDYLCLSLHNMSEHSFQYRHPRPSINFDNFFQGVMHAIACHAETESSMLLEFILMFSKPEWLSTKVWNLTGIENDTSNSHHLFARIENALKMIAEKNSLPFFLTREHFLTSLSQLMENDPYAPVLQVMPRINMRLVSLLPQTPETMMAINGNHMDQFEFIRTERGTCGCIKTPGFLVTGDFVACGYRSPFPDGPFARLKMGCISDAISIADILDSKEYHEFILNP